MKKCDFVLKKKAIALLLLGVFILMPAWVKAEPPSKDVNVINFPNPQNVTGTVNVGNFPDVQDVNVLTSPKSDATIKGIKCYEAGTTNSIEGPGTFISAVVRIQPKSTLTELVLEIDGEVIFDLTALAIRTIGLTQQNPFGIAVLDGENMESVVIGWPQPVSFESQLVLRSIRPPDGGGVEQIISDILVGQ
jgi:hypothetical protein